VTNFPEVEINSDRDKVVFMEQTSITSHERAPGKKAGAGAISSLSTRNGEK
jgi:hypothetical protein